MRIQESDMAVLLEVRHRIKPITNTAFDLFVDFYADTVVPATERHGIDLIGAWKMTGGEMGWDISLQRYESMAHAEECLASLAQDQALWSAVEKLRGEIEIEEVTKFTQSVSYGTEARLEAALSASPDQPRQYMLAVLQTATGGLLPAIDAIGGLVDTMDSAGALQLVTAYASRIGRSGELTDLWIMPHGASGMLDYRAGDPLKDIIGPLRKHAPEESITFLNPLPYSKLQ
ncbi:MAG: hypothetical protein F4066_03775 [Chloroflexi bacterium]|nr:hypothetical protein [Chloroflexota bacterium]MYF82414.1 hypothetical protein [Chloroflexota bacterium]MYI03961.1 hypothetical protein [Chloroflexota bacterium]